jgi:hypothetical protein
VPCSIRSTDADRNADNRKINQGESPE